ncbi:MAG: hypothetical protein M1833_004609 [Piccolia ochrophora]|nr:MAG: hypothetical protein M1833_004609 [Piccolia ochrophora]
MATQALLYKEEGNKRFQARDYKAADGLYTKAIIIDPRNHVLFTNRAFARIKLQDWDSVISDCLESIGLQPKNMKAYYYLAQAQMGLHHPSEALSSALTAYGICLQVGSPSASSISTLILNAKKEKWEIKERDRLRRRNNLLNELEERLEQARVDDLEAIAVRHDEGYLNKVEAGEEASLVEETSRHKFDELRSVFALAHPHTMQAREVPEYLIDNISFTVMHDPVITKTGQSYERSTILEHLRRSETDPLTREALRIEDLRPNLALRQACAEFLEKNGWAVDW